MPNRMDSMSEGAADAGARERLRRNVNGYQGENIDIAAVLGATAAAARSRGWTIERLAADPGVNLVALTRPAWLGVRAPSAQRGEPPRIYISTGIHGDEPAGPLAALRLLQEDRWPTALSLWLCPCLNPAGFSLNRRENPGGEDLNRQYLHPTAPETLAHITWLERQPCFDLCLCLHEDWESHGFYLYEQNPEKRLSLAPVMLAAAKEACPLDLSDTIEGRRAEGGVIRPNIDPRTRPQWPEAFYLLTHKTRLTYTLEAPSDFPLAMRVSALAGAVSAAVRALAARPDQGNPDT